MSREIHTIPPVFDSHSKILILGSFPSVKSRESQFFYGHPQNRFWKVMAQVLHENVPQTIPEKKEMFEKGTHFNPVDLVCAVRDYKGHKFDLVNFVDKATGFISYKSKNGKDLKALELPGLWNGAMSDWNTVFVEVSLSTFNPVKTVNDLLREQHQ